MTRSGLSYQIARKLKQYLDAMVVSSCRSSARPLFLTFEPQQEPYSVSESTPQQWKIGEGFMHLDNMFLVRLKSVSTGSWQPQISVTDPAM